MEKLPKTEQKEKKMIERGLWGNTTQLLFMHPESQEKTGKQKFEGSG